MKTTSGKGRRFALTTAILLASIAARGSDAAETIRLISDANLSTRAETRIETMGELKLLVTLDAEDGGKSRQKTTAVPVTVSAQLRYDDRPLGTPTTNTTTNTLRRAIRRYEIAAAKMQVGKGTIESTLSEVRKTIVVTETNEGAELFSPAGPLDRSELELLTAQVDSGLLNLLLPGKVIDVGSRWEPNQTVLARLLRLDVINQTDVALTLVGVEKKVALLEITGKVSGGVEGVVSDLELSGKLNFNLEQQCCTWAAMELKEARAASAGTPGFNTTSRIRVAIAPTETPPELTDDAIADYKTTPDEATRLLRFASEKQNFELVYEPKWRVVSDSEDMAVLRLIERGDLIAQCNASRLKPLGAGEQLTLEGFQTDLKRSLGKTFHEFVEAGESLGENGLRVLRVVISANVSEVPIHYVFYHLSDDHQNRLSLALTMDAEMAERFGRSEETLVNSLQFTTVPTKTQARAKDGKLKK